MLHPVCVLSTILPSADATLALGESIGHALSPGDSLALTGPLGSGKTHLVRGIAAGLDVPSEYNITSPTFAFMAQFPCRTGILYHWDLYRVPDEAALQEIGFFDTACPPGILVVEWWDRFLHTWRDDTWAIRMKTAGETSRLLEIWMLPVDGWETRAHRLQELCENWPSKNFIINYNTCQKL